MNQKKCPVCSSVVVGRRDKKFCSDQCRFIANNEVKLQREGKIVATNRQLRKNRNILRYLSPDGRTIVKKETLETLGYDFNVFTSLIVTKEKKIFYLCYEYGLVAFYENGIAKALIASHGFPISMWDPWKFVRT